MEVVGAVEGGNVGARARSQWRGVEAGIPGATLRGVEEVMAAHGHTTLAFAARLC